MIVTVKGLSYNSQMLRNHADSAAAADAESVSLTSLDVSEPERFRMNAHGAYFARLRREAPVHYCSASRYGPYWSITRYDDIVAVETYHRIFSSNGNVIIGDVPPEFDSAQAFITADPPVHTRERQAVAPAVSREQMRRLEERVRDAIAALLDGLPRSEAFNWVEKVSHEVTTQMIAVLFDFPWEQRHRLTHWSEAMLTTPAAGALVTSWDHREQVIEEYRSTMFALWRRRANEPRHGDILSVLAHGADGAAMIDDPARLMGLLTLMASANEAARGALSAAVVAFHEFPEEWRKLRGDRSLVENAASEIIRWQTPVSHMRRTAAEEVEFRGQRISKGDRVVVWYCSGNRDEAHFEAADELRVDRFNARGHVAFGAGIHRCLGSHVAGMQLRILLEEMLVRFESVEVVGAPRRVGSNFSSGFEEVLTRLPA
jgi:cytochrome P450